jgi:hypothetical protein
MLAAVYNNQFDFSVILDDFADDGGRFYELRSSADHKQSSDLVHHQARLSGFPRVDKMILSRFECFA